ncbi:uncharacterized protein UV8b_01125 [Ustilaginoidea virens]|uniref:DUF7732 domain-containing protein n=1 Tax=Ustilaginoidea virens TaxID=1159556 RepID=A0A8E5HK58_USTVR|nr:uncharacterized protein UV8b_01125 [Ustilaginoidea virens]QUC16884.1 hypothetical protein UV8b_01125 [Ustilaginoidea virens]
MRFHLAFVLAHLLSTAAAGVIGPQGSVQDGNHLLRRKGGGSGGGRGGGGGGGGGGSGGGGGGSPFTGGFGSAGSNGGGFRGNTASGSNIGGTSRGGSGPTRAYGGGGYYGGGAASPYRSGAATAAGVGALAFAAGALAFWPGLWIYGAYLYPHRNDYSFYNSTAQRNESLPVVCACAKYAVCGCDENTAITKELVGNGTYSALNKSIINVGDYNGRKTLLINGTLPNGTTADGPDQETSAGVAMSSLDMSAGLWPAVTCVIAAILLC